MDARTRLLIRRRTRPVEEGPEGGEIALVPYLDVVVNIIMFLLATAVVATAVANVRIDSAAGCGGCRGPSASPVTVAIGRAGFHVTTPEGVLGHGCGGPGAGPAVEGRDFEALSRCAVQVKRRFPDRTGVVVAADPGVAYETVVRTLDALRSRGQHELFPDVMLSAGVE